MSTGISVLLPAYDEAAHIADHLRRLLARLEADGRPFEILVIDDGSTDATAAEARRVAGTDARVRVLAHERNRGKGAALASGCLAARMPLVVFFDADLEIPPRDIAPLVARLEAAQADVAVGSKYHPEARLRWPPLRRALSRLYQFATALLFRLPLRDTQTGLKAVRREVAVGLVPRLRARRFAWDLELILAAHREGRSFVTGPVHVEPAARVSRVRPAGALHAGLDTLRIFARHVGLGAYPRRRPRAAPAPTRILVVGDDLGLSPSVDAGLRRGLAAGGLDGVSALVTAPGGAHAVGAVGAPSEVVGLHLDLLAGDGLLRAAWRLLHDGERAPRALRGQHAALAALGVRAARLDAHRHAWCLPWVYPRLCRTAAALGIRRVRPVAPGGPLRGHGLAEGAKRLLLRGLALGSRGVARAHGLEAADAWVGAREAAAWVADGAVPSWARGRSLEVIAHPAEGPADWPADEQGTLDRAAETRAVLEPPLAAALVGLAGVVPARTLPAAAHRPRGHAAPA